MRVNHEFCEMQILLIAATEQEIDPVVSTHTGADLLITGVGVPATIYHLQKRLHQLDYDLVIQAGIAGSFDEMIKPGQVVLVNKDRFADLGTEEKGHFRSVFEYGLANPHEFPFENGWLLNSNPLLTASPLQKTSGVTINTISDSPVQKQTLMEQFNPGVESMEGAALHYVCLQEQVPFIQVRSISNPVGERDRSKWKMTEAVGNLNLELEKLILHLKSTC